MENVCNLSRLESLIQKPTCYKNSPQPTCIDLILTNRPSYFQHSEVFETNLSDFHLLTVADSHLLHLLAIILKNAVLTQRT